MGTKPRKPARPPEPSSPPNELELPERWSVQRKTELVLRLLRGEPLDVVSRESQVPAHELETWKRVFLEQGSRGLKSRSDPVCPRNRVRYTCGLPTWANRAG